MIRNMSKTYFTELSRLLNLQSVLLGEALIDPVAGSYWRVPVAEDAIRLAGKSYAIQTDALGNGFTQEDKDMIDMQILASRKGQRIPHNDYKVVFYPDRFLPRVTIFVLALWAAFFGAAWTSITLPIRIGRLMFKIVFDTTTVHDGYSWIVGLYVFWFGSFAKYLVGREQRRWSKYLSTRTRNAFPVKLFLRHTAAMLGRLALAVLWLIFLLPGLIGLLFEIYVVLPITYQVYPGLTPTLRLMDAWTAGMIISAITLRAARLGQPDQLPELFERVSSKQFRCLFLILF
jgi:E3 ubiquitin-protein ligase DOA10